MFCPSCGSDQSGQYCRSCGKDLRAVRVAIEKSDVTARASAQQEIGRAVADKIRELHDADDLKKVVEDVLPEITKFFESPEEQRLRRIRAGTVMTAIGLGAAIAFSVLGALMKEEGMLFMAGAGLVTFLIGLGLMLNGWYFTVPRREAAAQLSDLLPAPEPTPKAQGPLFPTSVTDHTTHQLPEKLARKLNLE